MITKTDLLPHQAAAVDKLCRLKVGALYMEMGTGKTRTALELIKMRMEANKVDYVLWLCPCSVKGDLLAEISKHSDLPELGDVLTICGIETLSTSVKSCLELINICETRSVYLIVDESSLVKNPSALRSIHITQIAAKCKYKLILNGTPITKYEADLFSQWYILDWRILGYKSFYSFAANHLEYDKDHPGRIVRALNVDYLTRKIEPYTFQCKKADVMPLPPKHTSYRAFPMTDEQDKIYESVIKSLLTDLDKMSDAAIYQLFGALQSVTSGFSVEVEVDQNGRRHVKREPMFKNPADNPRISALLDVIREIPCDEKVIIICTYTQEIKDIAYVLNQLFEGSAVCFYGKIAQSKRQHKIEEFKDSKRFLIANKSCGAYGLNLQFCHNIVFYSHDWNWGTRVQAEDRVHRYGQKHIVEIVDIEAGFSVDQQILRCLSRKERLADSFKAEMERQSAHAFLRGEANEQNLQEAKRIRGNSTKV